MSFNTSRVIVLTFFILLAAEKDCVPAMQKIARCYEHGTGVPANYSKAGYWYHEYAFFHYCPDEDSEYENFRKSVQCYHKSVEDGSIDLEGMRILEQCYDLGDGVAADKETACMIHAAAEKEEKGLHAEAIILITKALS